MQTALGHQLECAGRVPDLLSPLQVGTAAASQAPAAPQAAGAGASGKPQSLMNFVTKMFEKIGQEPEHVKQKAQVDFANLAVCCSAASQPLHPQLAALTWLFMWHQLRALSFCNAFRLL